MVCLAETRHVSVRNFPYCTGPDYASFVSHFVYKGTLNERKSLKSRKNLTDLDDERSKRELYYHENKNNKNNNIENDDSKL